MDKYIHEFIKSWEDKWHTWEAMSGLESMWFKERLRDLCMQVYNDALEDAACEAEGFEDVFSYPDGYTNGQRLAADLRALKSAKSKESQ